MKTTVGVELQGSISITLLVSHMVLKKRKLNLLTNSVVCSCSHSCSTPHYFIEILGKENKNRAGLCLIFMLGIQT